MARRNLSSMFLCSSRHFSSPTERLELTSAAPPLVLADRGPAQLDPTGVCCKEAQTPGGCAPLAATSGFKNSIHLAALCQAVLSAASSSACNCLVECKFHAADHSHINNSMAFSHPSCPLLALAVCSLPTSQENNSRRGKSVLTNTAVLAAFSHLGQTDNLGLIGDITKHFLHQQVW